MKATTIRETIAQFTQRRVRELANCTELRSARFERLRLRIVGATNGLMGVIADASEGKVLDRRTLDALTSEQRFHISHDYRRSIPRGYVNPEVR